jgi:hypothetical protein
MQPADPVVLQSNGKGVMELTAPLVVMFQNIGNPNRVEIRINKPDDGSGVAEFACLIADLGRFVANADGVDEDRVWDLVENAINNPDP